MNLPLYEMGHRTKEVQSVYRGACPSCGVVHTAFLRQGMEPPYLIPPPEIKVACQCKLQVTSMTLEYVRGEDAE